MRRRLAARRAGGGQRATGDGRRATTWPAEILRSGQKHSAVTVMPAFPLVLEEVGYPADHLLLERQRQTRTLRYLGAAAADG